jgi:hypothetical protein
MKEKASNWSMSRHGVCGLPALWWMCGWMVVATSCAGEDVPAGGKISMRVGLAGIAQEEEALLRRSAEAPPVSECIPLSSGEELVVEWCEDPPLPLRAQVMMDQSALFRVLALKSSDKTLVDEEDCENKTHNGLIEVAYDTACDFLCYSFNTSASLGASPTIGATLPAASLNVGNTALNTLYYWAKRNEMPATALLDNIVLTPQLAKVKLMLDCSAMGKTISAVGGTITLGSLATSGKFDLTTGAISGTTPAAQSFTWSSLGGTTATSHELKVLPQSAGNLTLAVPKDAITLSGVTLQLELNTTLSNVAIVAGRSYTLKISFKRALPWSASNIYWDGSKLTFKEHGDPCANGEDNYQGVFFRWGSLVGLDPSVVSNGGTAWNNNNTLYVPTYTSASSHSWATVKSMTWDNGTSQNIPYVGAENNNTDMDTNRSTDFLALHTADTSYVNRRGDICRYLSHIGVVSKKYRMPTLHELRYGDSGGSSSATINYNTTDWRAAVSIIGYWTRIGTTWPSAAITTVTNAAGMYTGLTTGGDYSGYARFPAGGYRSNSTGSTNGVGTQGHYWSSSAHYAGGSPRANADDLSLSADWIMMENVNRWCGKSVRCLLDE